MATRTRDVSENTSEEPNSKWSHEQTLQFIELFKKEVHLWDRGHSEYRRTAPRQKAMKEICAELNVPMKELAKQIHRMQSGFNSIWRKMKDSPDKAAASRKNWPYYEHLRFLEKSYRILDESRAKKKKKKRVHNNHKRSTTRKRSDSDFIGFPKVEQETIISDDEDNFSDDCYIAVSSTMPSAGSFASSNDISMKFQSEQATPSSSSSSAAATHTPSMNAQSNDRVDIFFKAMADTVKSFPNKSIAQAKLRISQIVGEMELSLATEEEVLVASF